MFPQQSTVSYLELKNINLFDKKRHGLKYIYPNNSYICLDDLQLFFDPTWGSIWSIAATKNHYHFGTINPIRDTLKIFSQCLRFPFACFKVYIFTSCGCGLSPWILI